MPLEITVRYIHFLSILVLAAALVGQHLLLRPSLTRGEVRRAAVLDLIYLITAILILGTGLVQWFGVGKGAVFYTKNPIFHVKVTLFLIMGLVSIYPSIWIAKNKKGDVADGLQTPKAVLMCIRLELLLLVVIPLLATLMARGIGLRAA
jgi:putative membrane protein